MPKRRKKKTEPVVHLSAGPLPARLSELYAGRPLIFTDASELRHGGIAAVLFRDADGEPLVMTRSLACIGSNQLEFEALLLGLEMARLHCDGVALAVFSDNRDAVDRLADARLAGLAADPLLARRLGESGLVETFGRSSIHWIKGHSSCRGNAIADAWAKEAAGGGAVGVCT